MNKEKQSWGDLSITLSVLEYERAFQHGRRIIGNVM